MRPGLVLVDMSTSSRLVTQEIANAVTAKGAQMLDAPVSGGEKGAIEATLSIMVGGPEPVFTRVRQVFETLGKNVVHIGGGRGRRAGKTRKPQAGALPAPGRSRTPG